MILYRSKLIRQWMHCCLAALFSFNGSDVFAQQSREDISLNENWLSTATSNDEILPADFFKQSLDTKNWKKVDVPHNWDGYEGYRRLMHGNRHGDAWYRKNFIIQKAKNGKRFFLFFEGVGSYATVYLNGIKVGEHVGGRTSFTIDITDQLKTDGSPNLLTVRSWHPSNIKDLPWVCGGCSDERGFSEGSQPMGIFRPVHLIITNDARFEPFGVHAWSEISNGKAVLHVNTTIKNYGRSKQRFDLSYRLIDVAGKLVYQQSQQIELHAGDSVTLSLKNAMINSPILWSVENPYLYSIVTTIADSDKKVIDQLVTPFGFRTINWKNSTNQFVLNGKPVFINGVAEYEHLIGQSHAFSKEQIVSRMKWLRFAGFNAFRDGHQPHNLLYGQLCDEKGILWWTQLSAHVWYDSPEFRNNFKRLLKEWVIERRNSPSVILWGLQNESKLPGDFARECTELIRQLDPTASTERLVTTCNGGSGTDWDVPQNWTGTYGGDPGTYAQDIKKQVLIGEYGAWRTLGLHTEGPFMQDGLLSEDRMTLLMEQKIRLAESVKDSCAGQFFWLLTSHDNPGRVQGGEGYRELDRIGPVNYKGLLTPWEEPLDVFYMFRSNYAPKETQPMVYIVSHTWPGKWTKPGKKDSINVYSNCDEVELFNDIGNYSLGRKTKSGVGTHFEWRNVDVKYNLLYAVGYVNGKPVARDTILLHHLPASPGVKRLTQVGSVFKPIKGYNYIYRINCGGAEYTDSYNNKWAEDKYLPAKAPASFSGSVSWANGFDKVPPVFASQRFTNAVIKNSCDWPLLQTFRFGRDQLSYHLLLPDGAYFVELYFIEPWLGIGGGQDAKGMRLFDIAINGKTVIKDLDIWKEAGTNTALKKTVRVTIKGGSMNISFPRSASGQALISAIAVASLRSGIQAAPSYRLIKQADTTIELHGWLNEGDELFKSDPHRISSLPPNLFGSTLLRYKKEDRVKQIRFDLSDTADIFVGTVDSTSAEWRSAGYEDIRQYIEVADGTRYNIWRKRVAPGKVTLNMPGKPVVLLQPAIDMQPAYDLKPVVSYKAKIAQVSGEMERSQFDKRDVVMVKGNGAAQVDFPVQTGVADIYSLTVKYHWKNEQPVNGTIELIGPGNSRMTTQPLTFTFTRPGKWNTVTINTGTMINAGNYTVRIITEKATGLAISGIDIQ